MRLDDKRKSKREILDDIFTLFHLGRMDAVEFGRQLRLHKLTDRDIDLYCEGRLSET